MVLMESLLNQRKPLEYTFWPYITSADPWMDIQSRIVYPPGYSYMKFLLVLKCRPSTWLDNKCDSLIYHDLKMTQVRGLLTPYGLSQQLSGSIDLEYELVWMQSCERVISRAPMHLSGVIRTSQLPTLPQVILTLLFL